MTKLEKRKMIVVIVGIIILFIVIIGGGFLVFGKDENSIFRVPDISHEKSVEEVESANDLIKDCSGVLGWNLNIGNFVSTDNIDDFQIACKTDNIYSKMINYAYDENLFLILNVNVLKRVDNDVYKLDNTLIGKYVEANISNLLDNGTTFQYTYRKNGVNYQLIKIELIDPFYPEETNNEENIGDMQE